MLISPTDVSVELPAAPLSTTAIEGDLVGAEVVVHYLNGETARGGLRQLSRGDQSLHLQRRDGVSPLRIDFSELRYVAFTRRLTAVRGPHPVQMRGKDVEVPEPTQRFHITFIDGQTYRGTTRSSLVDATGLHLFQVLNEEQVARLFVPLAAVKDYHVGPMIGEALIAQAATSPTAIQAAIRVQEESRRKPLGEYLRSTVAVNAEQLKRALDHQSLGTHRDGLSHSPQRIGEILVDEGLIERDALEQALTAQHQDRRKKLGEILEEMGLVSVEEMYRTLAYKNGIPFVKLRGFEFDPQALSHVPADVARKYKVLPLFVYRDHLVVAMDDPTNVEAFDVIRFLTHFSLEIVVASRDDLQWAISQYYGVSEDLRAAEALQPSAPWLAAHEQDLQEAVRLSQEKPIVRLVSNLILDAVRRQVSDVHILPRDDVVDLLYRLDGAMTKIRSFSKGLLPALVSRIKVLGGMDIAERRLPQDGRAQVSDGNDVVDLRISIIPTVNGESVDIRLLNTRVGLKTIEQLGFSSKDQSALLGLLQRSFGLFLVTGPTGSGKSTTLYAALQKVRTQAVNVITVENPVEYHIDGIAQIQVGTVPGYTFATALRHILRHDPDVIMIGEIRDRETAKIAVESALTGHQVLSTLHTNSAAGAITRLVEMGVEPYLVSSTLCGVLAQRLVRRNCPHCMQEETPEPVVREALGVGDGEVFYRGVGCNECNGSGYQGRIAVYELLQVTPAIQALTSANLSVQEIQRKAVEEGMVPLTHNALAAARQRRTSLAEVYRVRLD